MVEVVEINNINELPRYRLLWNSLFAATPRATFFLTIDWLESCWRHFGDGHKLRVLIVYAAGEPLGILPLCVRRERYRLSTVRVLTYPLDDWGTWYGPIGPNPAATMLAAMQHIRRTPRDWDMIELRWVADDATQGGKTARSLRVANMLSEKQVYQTTSLVDLPADWETYLKAKPSSLRSEFRKRLRRVFEGPCVEFIRHRPAPKGEGDGDPRWDIYAMCEQVAAASWQSGLVDGNTLTHDRVRSFYRDAHAAAARLGMVDINILLFEGRPAAFLYNYHHQGSISALRMGYRTELAGHGLGSSLTLKQIEDGIARGDRTIDLGPGDGEHKRRMRTRVESTFRLSYTPLDSWRSQAVRWSRWAKRRWRRRTAAVGQAF